MANPEHLKILKQGVKTWNEWRKDKERLLPDLDDTDLTNANLAGANLTGADLRQAKLKNANLSNTSLIGADLGRADLSKTTLVRSGLIYTTFNRTKVERADFSHARLGATVFGNVDLSGAIGLEKAESIVPSTIGIDTLYLSKGKIPEVFLRGCGVPDEMIEFSRSLIGRPIEFNSCFISYSTKDEEFARRLHNDLQSNGVRCWFAPHDMKGGKKLHEQIDWAIHYHDRTLLILSPDSINSQWVKTEIAKARKREIEEKRQVLFPIRLVEFDALRKWEYFDADTGTDYAKEIREYFIPDFSNWKDHDSYQTAFKKLLQDLRGERTKPESAPDRLPFGVFSANY